MTERTIIFESNPMGPGKNWMRERLLGLGHTAGEAAIALTNLGLGMNGAHAAVRELDMLWIDECAPITTAQWMQPDPYRVVHRWRGRRFVTRRKF